MPLECEDSVIRNIEEQVRAAIQAIGLDNCAVNADLMIKDGEAYVLELTGRLGANAIPEITTAYYGRDIHEFIVEIALGDYDNAKSFRFESDHETVVCAQMLISERDGRLKKASIDDDDCDAWFFLKEGQKVSRFRSPGDCIGQVVVTGKTMQECKDHVNRILESLEVE